MSKRFSIKGQADIIKPGRELRHHQAVQAAVFGQHGRVWPPAKDRQAALLAKFVKLSQGNREGRAALLNILLRDPGQVRNVRREERVETCSLAASRLQPTSTN